MNDAIIHREKRGNDSWKCVLEICHWNMRKTWNERNSIMRSIQAPSGVWQAVIVFFFRFFFRKFVMVRKFVREFDLFRDSWKPENRKYRSRIRKRLNLWILFDSKICDSWIRKLRNPPSLHTWSDHRFSLRGRPF